MNDFNSIIEGLMAKDSNSNENLRMVEENESEQDNGVKKEDIISNDIYGINLCYRLQNDIGQGYQEKQNNFKFNNWKFNKRTISI